MRIVIGACSIVPNKKIYNDIPGALRDLASALERDAQGSDLQVAFGARAPEIAKDFLERAGYLRKTADSIDEAL